MLTLEQVNKFKVWEIENELKHNKIKYCVTWVKNKKLIALINGLGLNKKEEKEEEIINQLIEEKEDKIINQLIEEKRAPKKDAPKKVIKRIEPVAATKNITDFKEAYPVKENIKTLLKIKEDVSYIELRKLLLEYFKNNNLFNKDIINIEILKLSQKEINFTDIDTIVNMCFC